MPEAHDHTKTYSSTVLNSRTLPRIGLSKMTKLLVEAENDRKPLDFDARLIRTLVLAFVGIRLVYAAMIQLVPDEATYWVWSRHLAASYFDHPPMIAYLIRAGTYLLGHQELGVRFGGVLMAAGSIVVTVGIARRILGNDRGALWVALIWATSPLLAIIGLIITPDTPMIFFSVCALAIAIDIAHQDDLESPHDSTWRRGVVPWLLFGVLCGLALLSKYTAILLPASVVAALLLSPKGRIHYRRPGIYLAGVVALAMFSPVIWWNWKHHWASFAFQLHHGMSGSQDAADGAAPLGRTLQFFKDLGIYVGGQFFVWTPTLFVASVIVLVSYWRRHRTLAQVDRVLLWAGTVPLAFFGVMYLRSHGGEANWPAFGYFPISLLIGRWMLEKPSERRTGLVRGSIQLALGILIVIHVIAVPRVTQKLLSLKYRMPHAISDTVAWRDFGRAVGQQAYQNGLPLVANRHEVAAEASFYAPGQPDVWCVSVGSRPTAYDYFDDRPDFAKIPGVVWIGGHVDLFEKQYGYVERSRTSLMFLPGPNQRVFRTYVLVRPRR